MQKEMILVSSYITGQILVSLKLRYSHPILTKMMILAPLMKLEN